APRPVPASTTAAPASGAPLAACATLPLIAPVWPALTVGIAMAKAVIESMSHLRMRKCDTPPVGPDDVLRGARGRHNKGEEARGPENGGVQAWASDLRRS